MIKSEMIMAVHKILCYSCKHYFKNSSCGSYSGKELTILENICKDIGLVKLESKEEQINQSCQTIL